LRSEHAIESPATRDSSDPAAWLVAHRGWPQCYPENSLAGLEAVLEAGARWVEFDVQISADGYPVVIHDDELSRLSGLRKWVTRSTLAELQRTETRSPAGATAPIPTLDQVLCLIGRYPEVTTFVELKRQSIDRQGLNEAVRAVLEALEQARGPVVFISFRWRAVRLAKRIGRMPVGWVFKPWSPLARWFAGRLQPDYLLVRADRVPRREKPFWNGPWQWVIYGVDTLEQARALKDRGADLIEVDDLPGLISTESG